MIDNLIHSLCSLKHIFFVSRIIDTSLAAVCKFNSVCYITTCPLGGTEGFLIPWNNSNVTVSGLCHPYCFYVHLPLLFLVLFLQQDQVQQGPKHNEEQHRLSTPSQVPALPYMYTDTDYKTNHSRISLS